MRAMLFSRSSLSALNGSSVGEIEPASNYVVASMRRNSRKRMLTGSHLDREGKRFSHDDRCSNQGSLGTVHATINLCDRPGEKWCEYLAGHLGVLLDQIRCCYL